MNLTNSKIKTLFSVFSVLFVIAATPVIASDNTASESENAFSGEISENSHPSMGTDTDSDMTDSSVSAAASTADTIMDGTENVIDELASDVSNALSDISPAAGDVTESEQIEDEMNNMDGSSIDTEGTIDEEFSTEEQKNVTP